MAKFWRTVVIVVLFLMFVLVAKTVFSYGLTIPALDDPLDDPDTQIIGKALDTNDVSLCENVSSAKRRDDCYYQMQYRNDGHEICERIVPERGRDMCFHSAAIASPLSERSHELCDRISDNCYTDGSSPSYSDYGTGCPKTECHDYVYINSRIYTSEPLTISICNENVKIPAAKNDCYSWVAILEKNESICDNIINDEKFKNEDCVYNVALSAKNATLCNKLTDNLSLKTVCSAVITGDKNLCDRPEVGHRFSCLRVVCAANTNDNSADCIEARWWN